jgi:D-alanine-D-alanine ligase
MGHPLRLCILVLHNRDFETPDHPEFASRADVENAARDIVRALGERGHTAEPLAVAAGDAGAAVAETLAAVRARSADLVFNLCESLAGDARHECVLPSLFELTGVRYTGSGPFALGAALRKDRAKAILRAHGVPTPAGFVVAEGAPLPSDVPPFPLIVKPAREDASTGIWLRSVVHDRKELEERVAEVRARYRQPVLVEQFIAGREIYVSLVGNGDSLQPLPMHEVDFSEMPSGAPHIVTYEGKWNTASPEYRGTRSIKAALSGAVRARVVEAARAAFFALELRDYARVDVRLAADGRPHVIDVNPNCDLSDGAGVSRAASFGGIAYPELIERVCLAAWSRYERVSPHVLRDRAAQAAPAVAVPRRAADDPPAPAPRSRAPASAPDQGRAVHARGGLGRARARRRRAR